MALRLSQRLLQTQTPFLTRVRFLGREIGQQIKIT